MAYLRALTRCATSGCFGLAGLPALVIGLLSGCTGSVAEGPGPDPSGQPSPSTPGTPPDPLAPPPEVEFRCDGGGRVQIGPTPMRRLSHVEYANTVRDLLGAATRDPDLIADPTIDGYDNNAYQLNVPATLAEGYFAAAEAAALAAAANLAGLVPCQTQDEACATRFIVEFGRRAYRRPLDDTERDILLRVYGKSRQAGDDFPTAVRLILTTILQSPQFLYRVEIGAGAPAGGARPLSGYEVASRLSYLLWATMPDEPLFAAAEAGALATTAQVLAQARRMLTDPAHAAAARRGLARFTEQWVPVTSISPTLAKDTAAFRDWTAATPTWLRNELQRFLDHVTWEAGGQLATFLTAPYTFMDRNLVSFYKASDAAARASDVLVKVNQDPARYAGILTKGGFLAKHASPVATKPVARGIFIRQQLLCDTVPPPIADPKVDAARQQLEAPAMETQKQKLARIIAEPACVNCHQLFNPLGLALESFDAVGRWRAADGGQAIDPSGEVLGTDIAGPFADHVDLARKLAGSAQASQCFVKQVFRFSAGRNETAGDSCTLTAMDGAGRESGYDVKQILLGVVASPGFLYREAN